MNAIVTGGSRGIGAAVAIKLASLGYDIVISYRRSEQEAQKVIDLCKEHGVGAIAVKADAASEADCENLAQAAREAFGPVSVLVNNAGITRDGLAMRMGLDQFTDVIDANLTGTFMMCKACMPDMVKARRGAIVNMTSIAGVYGNAGQANYSASKAGVIGLTKSLAKELGKRKIRVNAIAPGFVETDMTAYLSDDLKQKAIQNIPLGRLGQPEDIAETVAFLVSEQASYITGQVLEVSGGMVL